VSRIRVPPRRLNPAEFLSQEQGVVVAAEQERAGGAEVVAATGLEAALHDVGVHGHAGELRLRRICSTGPRTSTTCAEDEGAGLPSAQQIPWRRTCQSSSLPFGKEHSTAIHLYTRESPPDAQELVATDSAIRAEDSAARAMLFRQRVFREFGDRSDQRGPYDSGSI
jgi:hypothetical protein